MIKSRVKIKHFSIVGLMSPGWVRTHSDFCWTRGLGLGLWPTGLGLGLGLWSNGLGLGLWSNGLGLTPDGLSLCQRLDSRQLTQIRAPEARGKSSAKRERERRRRESPPEAKGERSEPFAGGARDSAKRNRVFVIMAKFLSPSSHVTCQNWIRPFTKKHRFIAQIDSARSNILVASTAWRPRGLSPDIGYRVPENVLYM